MPHVAPMLRARCTHVAHMLHTCCAMLRPCCAQVAPCCAHAAPMLRPCSTHAAPSAAPMLRPCCAHAASPAASPTGSPAASPDMLRPGCTQVASRLRAILRQYRAQAFDQVASGEGGGYAGRQKNRNTGSFFSILGADPGPLDFYLLPSTFYCTEHENPIRGT